MPVRVGLMGFGRIGRNIFRILYDAEDVQVVAISDIADHKGLEYLLKYDTIMGRFPEPVSVRDGYLYTHGRQVKMLAGREPGDVDWGSLAVDVVVEATARYRSREDVQRHIDAGAGRVIMCVPPTDEPDRTVVMGFNHEQLQEDERIISNGSITAHCAAPIVDLIHGAFGLERMYFTTVHAYTNDQRLADVPSDDLRRGRAASENIIPTETKSDRVLEKLMPELEGRISGMALKVPVPNGSLVDMTMFTEKPVTVDAVNEVVRTGIHGKYKKYVEYVEDPIVSSDVKLSPYSSTFDSLATMTAGDHTMKTVAWYDNGWGYAHRVVDLIKYISMTFGGDQ